MYTISDKAGFHLSKLAEKKLFSPSVPVNNSSKCSNCHERRGPLC